MWIFTKSMCFPSAPVVQAWTSASDWPFQALARSAGLNGKRSRPASFYAAWKRANWMKRLVSRICDPSTANRGVASWIASLRASRASRTLSPASDLDEMMSATCGPTFRALSARFGQASCVSKTCREYSLFTEASSSVRSAQTLKEWVSRLRLASSRRRKLARRTKGNESSYSAWPTPKSRDVKGQSQRGDAAPMDALPNMAESFHCSHPDQETLSDGEKSLSNSQNLLPRRLSPIFVMWMMGWPLTVLGCFGSEETGLSRFKQRMRSDGCGWLFEASGWEARMRDELDELTRLND